MKVAAIKKKKSLFYSTNDHDVLALCLFLEYNAIRDFEIKESQN